MKKLKLIIFALLLCGCNSTIPRNQKKDIQELKQQYQIDYGKESEIEIKNVRYLGRDEVIYESYFYVYDYYQYDLFVYYKENGYTRMHFELDKIYKKETKKQL